MMQEWNGTMCLLYLSFCNPVATTSKRCVGCSSVNPWAGSGTTPDPQRCSDLSRGMYWLNATTWGLHQRWADCHILRSRSSPDLLKLSPSPKNFSNVKSKSKWRPKKLKNAAFSQQKCRISFPLSQSNSGPDPKLWSDLQCGSNPN